MPLLPTAGSRRRAPRPRLPAVTARIALLLALPWLTHCATAPSLKGVEPSYALPPVRNGALDAAVMRELGEAPGRSGLRLVEQNALAFAYRAATADAATSSIDVQYYIWSDDLTGRLLAAELLRAAERGVRVRMLLDDIDARAKHELFRVADLHPNIEVRIFNPFYSRSGTMGLATEWLTRTDRLNRRMHNKAWIVDNAVAIVGGRNIGDEYFGASEHSNFSDLDLVLSGPAVADVSRAFDEYWNNPNAVPVSRFDVGEPEPGALEKLIARSQEYRESAAQEPYVAALRDEEHRAELIAERSPPLHVDAVQVLVDDPSKVGAKTTGLESSVVLSGLAGVMSSAASELLIVSPYFVPRKDGTRNLIAGVQRGVRTAVLTNSLAATDIAAVHTGYARQRRELLRGGVELFEMKRKAGSEEGRRQISVTGSSGTSLHTKAMIIDRNWVYIGSMNLDPRSAFLNTEMGILVESPELAEQVREQFERTSGPDLSYRVVMEGRQGLVWYDRARGEERRLEREPDASVGRRLAVTLLRLLPIDSLL